MKNVSKILAMFSAHPVIFLLLIYFAIPILIYALIFDFCSKYVFPILGILFKKLGRQIKHAVIYMYRKLVEPKKTIRRIRASFLRRKRLKRDKKRLKQKKTALKVERAQIIREANSARKERIKRHRRQRENFKQIESSQFINEDDKIGD